MEWRRLLEPEIQEFIRRNETADVCQLALKKAPDASWPYPLILDQIKIHQKASKKAPECLALEGFIFPPSFVFEQASSEACASYKASFVGGGRLIDLTAGCGIDAFFMAKNFSEVILVDHDPLTAALLMHNASVLKAHGFFTTDITVHEKDAKDFLNTANQADLIYIDPQRRENNRKGIFDFTSCSPDITTMLSDMMEKARCVLIKTSPVLDIHQALESLKCVSEVHVIGWNKDCKEVLYFIDKNKKVEIDDVVIKAVDILEDGAVFREFSYRNADEKKTVSSYSYPKRFVYEPGPSFMKAGGFESMAQTYGAPQLHPHSHLYTSDDPIEGFPGRGYEVLDVVPASQKTLPFTQAEISVRNFPEKPEILRKKLKLKEGGNHRVFATTLIDNSKKLLLCRKIT